MSHRHCVYIFVLSFIYFKTIFSRDEAGHETLTRGVEKYSAVLTSLKQQLLNEYHNVLQGTMLFGGLSVRGLIPPTSPIFMDEIKAQWVASGQSLGKRGGITAEMYKWMISKARVDSQSIGTENK